MPPVWTALAADGVEIVLDDLDVAEADYARLAADHDVVVGHSLTGEMLAGADRLARFVLAREPVDVALPVTHVLASRPDLTAADVVDEPWIGVPRGYPFDEVLRSIELRAGRAAHRRQRVRDNRLVEAFVGAGLGLPLLPRFTTRARPDLVLRPLRDVPATRWIVALSRPDRAERAVVRRVVHALQAQGRAPGP